VVLHGAPAYAQIHCDILARLAGENALHDLKLALGQKAHAIDGEVGANQQSSQVQPLVICRALRRQ